MSKWDKLLAAAILTLSVVSLIFINVFAFCGAPDTVIIELDGKEYAKYPLKQINSSKSIEIKSEYGYNKIELFSVAYVLLRRTVRTSSTFCREKLRKQTSISSVCRTGW